MKHSLIFLLVLILTVSVYPVNRTNLLKKETITFKSKDSVNVTADLYLVKDSKAPFILLFHQAGWSRGEYNEIAPKLNEMGFNCMAVDLRAGGGVNFVQNLTHQSAVELKKGTSYIDAIQDIEAAVNFARKNYAKGKIILWGSSYSASLVIKYAGDHPKNIDGVLAFSPGEYFEKAGKSKTYIQDAAKNVKCPVFITSARSEKVDWDKIYNAIPSKNKIWFLPSSEGYHGARVLWKQFKISDEYWKAVDSFLSKNFLTNK